MTPRALVALAALAAGCGSSAPPPRAVSQADDEPALASGARDQALSDEASAGAPEGPPAFPRCEAGTTAVEGLDPAPSLHALPAPTASTLASSPSSRGEPLGGDVSGFVWWTSDNGRYALLMRFEGGPPSFGHHGEVMNASGVLWLVDLEASSHEAVAEMIAAAPTAIAIRTGDDRIVLVRQDGERTDLSALGIDARPDANRCLNRRQVSFDPTGRFAAWLARGPARAVVRDLWSGDRCQVEAEAGELWRAYPGAVAGWALLREIPSDTDGDGELSFPVQNTSCACRWCNRFALSYGFYGWAGDAFESVFVAPDGSRVPVEGPAHAVGDSTVARVDPEIRALELVDAGGQAVTLPTGCSTTAVAPGASSVLLTCGSDAQLFFPENGRSLDLPAQIEASGVLDSRVTEAGHVWATVRASSDGATWHLARLRMNDGRIETGPEASALAGVESGWAIGTRDGGLSFLHLGDGHTATVDLDAVRRVLGLAVRLEDDRTALIAPRQGRHLVVDAPADAADEQGCALAPAAAGDRGIARGPWRRTCP